MTTQDFVASLVDKFAELVVEKIYAQHGWNGGKFEALEARMERLDKLVENTLNNAPAILENLSDRQQKLEDKFDQLTTASDERIVEIVKSDGDIADYIGGYVDQKLEDYEPAEHLDFDDLLNNSYALEDKIKDEVRSLDWSVEVRVR